MKNNRKTIAMLIMLGVMILVLWFLLLGSYKLKGVKYLNSNQDHTGDYFNETNIGDYEELYFQLFHKNVIFYESDASTLIATYNADEYSKQVNKIENEIPFLNNKDESGVYSDFEIGEWNFRVCKFEGTIYPKNFAMIGFHEETCEIAYLEFCNVDQDYITGAGDGNGSMEDFIERYFKYDFK